MKNNTLSIGTKLVLGITLIVAGFWLTSNFASAAVCNPIGTYVTSGFLDANHVSQWIHNMTISSFNSSTGAFSGTGYWQVDTSYTWTVSGIITGNNYTLNIVYTGTGAGYTAQITGTINDNDEMTGRFIDNGNQIGTWTSYRTTPSSCSSNPSTGLVGSYAINGIVAGNASSQQWIHHMDVTSYDSTSGNFNANGYWVPDPRYTWTGTGKVTNGTYNINIQYTGLNPQYKWTSSGTIGANSNWVGTASDNGNQIANWWTATKILSTTLPATPAVTCSSNSQCGTNGVTGSSFCQGNGVYQNYTTYTCNNAGTATSSCSSSTTPQLQTTCSGSQTCNSGTCTNTASVTCSSNSQCGTNGLTGSQFCQGNGVYQNYTTYTCNNAGTATSSCSSSTVPQLQTNCSGSQTCNNGTCSTNASVTCSSNSQCGSNGFTGSQFCQGNGVYQNYTTYTCNNAGASNSSCSSSTVAQQTQTCSGNQTCSNGSCFTTTNNTCSPNASQRCSGNAVYWYDSCGNQQGLAQICSGNQTCSVNTCINTNNIYNTCSPNASQRCSGNAVYWYDSCGNQQGLAQTCAYNQTCSGNVCTNFNTVTNTNIYTNTYATNRSIYATESGRNLSSGNLTWSQSLTASPSDIIEFRVLVQSNAPTTINNVVVKEIFPANISSYNNLTLDGIAIGGDITQGINIGSISPGQTKTITYQAQIAQAQNFSFGTTTIYDPVTITSNDPNFLPTTVNPVSILVSKSGVYGASTVSTGLTNNFWVDSFFLPLVLALLGIWLYRSKLIGVPSWVGSIQLNNKETSAQKELQNKIAMIKKTEGK